jgi:hypothetical protein
LINNNFIHHGQSFSGYPTGRGSKDGSGYPVRSDGGRSGRNDGSGATQFNLKSFSENNLTVLLSLKDLPSVKREDKKIETLEFCLLL